MSSSSVGSQAPGPEPPMFLQRPSSARSQDITHVLARTFRELFTREAVGPDTVKYLNISRGGEDEYHEKYVEALHKVQEERDRRMAEAAMLERHIMQAQARAMSAEEREINRVSSASSGFPDIGLPPTRSHFSSCINSEVLRKYNLITPEDFATEESLIVPPPQAPKIPSYARETVSSQVRKSVDADGYIPSPLPQIMENGSINASSLSSLVDPDELEDPSPNNMGVGKDMWKNQMNPEEREQNRAHLATIQSRVDYLKNQRFIPPSAHGAKSLIKTQKKQPKEVGIKPKPKKKKVPTATLR